MKARRWALLCLAAAVLGGCRTMWGGIPDEQPGPKPTNLRAMVIQTLNPDSAFRPTWRSEIGPIGDHTEMVMTEVQPGKLILQGGWTRREFAGWKFCATLVNPPAEGKTAARTGVLGVWTRGVGLGNPTGLNRCLWVQPSEEYKAKVAAAIDRQKGKAAVAPK